jgi:hypothetical protein
MASRYPLILLCEHAYMAVVANAYAMCRQFGEIVSERTLLKKWHHLPIYKDHDWLRCSFRFQFERPLVASADPPFTLWCEPGPECFYEQTSPVFMVDFGRRGPSYSCFSLCEGCIPLFLALCREAQQLYVEIYYLLRRASQQYAVPWEIIHWHVWAPLLAPTCPENILHLRSRVGA